VLKGVNVKIKIVIVFIGGQNGQIVKHRGSKLYLNLNFIRVQDMDN